MGAWGTAPWDDDLAADWFDELFQTTKLALRVEETLNRKDVKEYAPEIRAAAFVLVSLGRNYIWPVQDLDRHLALAVARLEAIRKLPDYEGVSEIDEEIAELRSRLTRQKGKARHKTQEDAAKAQGEKALRDLSDPDSAIRFQAAKWIGKQARGETSNFVEAWLAKKEATGAIIRALSDSEPTVAEEAVCAFLHTCIRYFPDRRGYPGVVRLLKSNRQLTRICAVQAAGFLGGEESLNHVLPLLADRAAAVRAAVLRAVRRATKKRISRMGKKQICAALVPTLLDKDLEVRMETADLLCLFDDGSVLVHLENALAKERNRSAKESLKEAIKDIRKRS